MIIHINVALPGVSPFKRNVKIEVTEGTTLDEFLDMYIKKHKVQDHVGKNLGLSFLVNGARGDLNRILKNDDKVKIFRPRIRG